MILERVSIVFDWFLDDGNASSDTADIPAEFRELRTPLSPSAIYEAQELVGDRLTEQKRSLPELLVMVQEYVDQQEYSRQPGNAFFEQLVQDFNDPQSLREPIRVTDDELLFIVGAEGWARIAEELGFTDTEALAVRDAHQLYCNSEGYAEYGPLVNVMAVTIDDADRVRELVEITDVSEEAVDLPASRGVYRGEMSEAEESPAVR